MADLRIAVVCSSNQNRSMEAHSFLGKKGFKVRSFGTGNQVKLPGPSPNQPNIYDFNTTYDEMYKDLLRKDAELYRTVTRCKKLKVSEDTNKMCLWCSKCTSSTLCSACTSWSGRTWSTLRQNN